MLQTEVYRYDHQIFVAHATLSTRLLLTCKLRPLCHLTRPWHVPQFLLHAKNLSLKII